MEGVLVPEIWIAVAKKTKIDALKITTRDEPNYDLLMKRRLSILKNHGIKLRDIERVIGAMSPLPGAKQFLDKLKANAQVIILSDTYYEFAAPLMRKLGGPTLFCNWLSEDKKGFISNYHLRIRNGKEHAVKALQKLNFKVHAAGDSYNDLTMLLNADKGVFFNPPDSICKQYPKLPVARSYGALFRHLID